ncbi:hypothetical protein D3C76_1764910 [compost metagenome]
MGAVLKRARKIAEPDSKLSTPCSSSGDQMIRRINGSLRSFWPTSRIRLMAWSMFMLCGIATRKIA